MHTGSSLILRQLLLRVSSARYSHAQGNMDPGVLFGSKQAIEQRVVETVRAAQGTRHVMNLGHGVLVGTPEESVAHFFEVAKTVHERM